LLQRIFKFRGSETSAERHEKPSNKIYPDFLSAMSFLLSFLISKKESRSVWERNETKASVEDKKECRTALGTVRKHGLRV